MNDNVHPIFDGLHKVGGSKGGINYGDHPWKGLSQGSKGIQIEEGHGWVCWGLTIQDLQDEKHKQYRYSTLPQGRTHLLPWIQRWE